MPSPRSSPALRPSSPLSPRYDAGRYDTLQPSPRALHGRPNQAQQRRNQVASLMLPALPRFHPANFPSNQSSAVGTPTSGPTSPTPPALSQQKLYTDAQKQLFIYRETLAGRASSTLLKDEPISPKLAPAGSPGPVTPFELEEADGYLGAGERRAMHHHRSTLSGGATELAVKLDIAAEEQDKSHRLSSSESS